MSKPRIIRDYHKLSEELQEQLKLVYPKGFDQHLISFNTQNGDKHLGLPFETEEYYYLVRMSKAKAIQIVEEDDDFDDDGNLIERIKENYEDKYDDLDYLSELNNNDDNDFEEDDGYGDEDDDEDDDED